MFITWQQKSGFGPADLQHCEDADECEIVVPPNTATKHDLDLIRLESIKLKLIYQRIEYNKKPKSHLLSNRWSESRQHDEGLYSGSSSLLI